MDSDRFDRLIRTIEGEASRRGVVRAGLGGLAAVAAAAFGLGFADDDAAGAKERPKRRKREKAQRGKAQKKKARVIPGPQGPPGPPGPPAPPQTCTASRPVTCGDGCCPATMPLCCDSDGNPQGKSCNPSGDGWHCCDVATQGGDACGGRFPKCCPITPQFPFGFCTETTATCCTAAQGGGACLIENPQCCPVTPQARFGQCIKADDVCCGSGNGGTSCPNGTVCCPNIFSAPDTQGCCASEADCCADSNQCSAPTPNCVNGCCQA